MVAFLTENCCLHTLYTRIWTRNTC